MEIICAAFISALSPTLGPATTGAAVPPMVHNSPTNSMAKDRPVTRALCPQSGAVALGPPSLAARAANQGVAIHGHSRTMTAFC